MDVVVVVLGILASLVVTGLVSLSALYLVQCTTVDQQRRRQRWAQSQLDTQLQRATQEAIRQMLLQTGLERDFAAGKRANAASVADVVEGDVVESHE